MTALTISASLTEQQRELVRYMIVEGKPPEEAAQLAGYHPKSAYRTLRLPAVAAAISENIQLDLAAVGAPLAYRVAKSLLADVGVSARVRADLSIKVLYRAGHIAPTRKDQAAEKALSEMSRDELAAFIDRNQTEIDKIESELAARRRIFRPTLVTSRDRCSCGGFRRGGRAPAAGRSGDKRRGPNRDGARAAAVTTS